MSLDFTKKEYYRSTFTNIQLPPIGISLKIFEQCQFNYCKFLSSNITDCQFIDCTFNNSLLTGTNFSAATISGVKFKDSKVDGINWTNIGTIIDLKFFRCNLDYANFNQLDLKHTVITHSTARHSKFIETNLSESNLRYTDFQDALFHQTNLSRADLRHSTGYLIDIRNNNLSKTKLSLPEAINLLQPFDLDIT